MNEKNREYFNFVIGEKKDRYSEDAQWTVVQLLNIDESISRWGKTVSTLLALIFVVGVIALIRFW